MFAYENDRNSCYIDTVLVCMFTSTHVFDFVWEHPRTRVAKLLEIEATRLRQPQGTGWVCTDLRNAMGQPWNTSTPQSAVDCFHALLDMCGVSNLGYQQEQVFRTPRALKPVETSEAREQEFRVHLAVAGVHESLYSVFITTEDIDVSTSEYRSVKTKLLLTYAPVLVFEVGRNESNAPIEYGYVREDNSVTLHVCMDVYTLTSVVCRKGAHYIAFVWKDSNWWFYDDLLGARLVRCGRPELTPYMPSRYGELFFYT